MAAYTKIFTRSTQPHNTSRISSFFGRESYERVTNRIRESSVDSELSAAVFEETLRALKRKRDYYVMPFLVEFDSRKRDSYYLVFLSKNPRGFSIMRDIMLKRGLHDKHGIPSPIYSELRNRELDQYSMQFVTTGDNLEKLSSSLSRDFGGMTECVELLMDSCLRRNYHFTDAHIRKALKYLRDQGRLEVVSAPTKRAKDVIGNKAVVRIV